jgi:hypothetical protein
MTTNWTKNTYVCDPDECDTLIEITTSDKFGFPSGTIHNAKCPCGRTPNLLSVEPATIAPNYERKEMETTSTMADTYNPNLLVTYKSINDNYEATYPTIKVVDLESKLDSLVRLEKQLIISNGQISKILDNLSADGWYNPNYEKLEVLNDLCEILGHEPKQTVRITATVSVEVDYDIPLDEVEDFDARYFLNDNLTIDTYNGDATVDSWTVEDSDVNW